jgi:hypothetical protein
VRTFVKMAAVGLAAMSLVFGTSAPVNADTPVLPVPAVVVDPLPVGDVSVVSKTGRFVITSGTLYDAQKRRVIKTFPASATVVSISDDGRYVTYTLPGKARRTILGQPTHKWDYKQATVRVFDRKTRTTRTATTTRTGKALKPAWRSPCIAGTNTVGQVPCEEGFQLPWAPQLVGGQISGNGRYIVFCANYTKANRIDLYIKDWRTKRLTIRKGACSFLRGEMDDRILPPSVSENGATILLPGWLTYPEGPGAWGPSKALINRKRLIEIGGITPSMTHDGKTLSIQGAFRSDEAWNRPESSLPVTWYHLPTGVQTPADPPGLRLTMQNASRHGRFVVELVGTPSLPLNLTLRDRTAGVTYNLTPALEATGYHLRDSTVPAPILTGDGKVVFVPTTQGWVMARWTP